ncbi:TonB-dependent receptor [Hyphomonas sp.]|uniref:TonB-dependent receptor n=1 Tax=Hyphomonas sp. TaxID=87 RepID=UPI0033405ACB
MKFKTSILLSTAVFAATAFSAQAQAPVEETPAAADASTTAVMDQIVIIGGGEVRQTQTVTAEVFEQLAPGTSPIKLVERLPGVAVSGADPFGAYEWAVRINIRGFNQNQLGFSLDGVPLGDMSYGNHNGLHISRALISENLGQVDLQQGSGALDVASSSNLGGALKFSSVDAADKFGAVGALTTGSNNTLRGFARLDSGELGPFQTRGWLSIMSSEMDKWKGDGQQNQDQYALKIVQPIGPATVTGYFNRSERRENDYQDLSLGQISSLGSDWDNFGDSNYALAVLVADIAHRRGDTGQPVTNPAAPLVYPAPITSADDAYWNASGLRDDDLGYIALDWPVSDALDLRLQAYTHKNKGQGLWGTPYLISPNALTPGATTANAPLSVRTTEYSIDRQGATGSLTYEIGDHEIEGGFWIETNSFDQFRRFYSSDRAAPTQDFLNFLSNPFFTQWGYTFDTETRQFFLQDTWQVTDALKVNGGFKSLKVENSADTLIINNALPVAGTASDLNATIETDEAFLPQIGFNYKVSDQTDVFGSYAQNAAAFVSAATAGPFSSRNQTVVNEVISSVDAESSQTYEAGIRYTDSLVQLGAAAYMVEFDDRLLAVSQGPGIVGNAPVISNVGGVETKGIELVGSVFLSDDLTLFGSFTFNDSRYQDNVVNRAGVVQALTAGKKVVNTPDTIAFAEVSYDNGSLFGSLGANYIGNRYFTFTNTGGDVPGRTLVDASLGYRFGGNALLEGLEIQLNATNLFDEDYVGTLGTNGFVNSGDSQTLVTGAPQQVFVTLRKAF